MNQENSKFLDAKSSDADRYFHHTEDAVIVVESIVTVHYFKYAKNFHVPGETHDFYELVFVDSGEVDIKNGDEHHTLSQGKAFIHRPNVFHNIKANNVFSNIIIVTFKAQSISEYDICDKILSLSEAEKLLLGKMVTCAGETFLGPLDLIEQYKMEKREDAPLASMQLLFLNLTELLLLLCRTGTPSATAKRISHRTQAIERTEAYLSAHIDTRLSLKEISDALNYSVPYLKKLFRAEKHMGIIQYHTHLKIERAKQLIAENDLSLTEIAQALAFAGLPHFSAAFRKATNMSPSEFLKSTQISKLLK